MINTKKKLDKYNKILLSGAQFKHLKDFRKTQRNEYEFLVRNKLVAAFCETLDMPRGKSKKAMNFDIAVSLSADCKSLSEYGEKHRTAYRYLLTNGLVDDFCDKTSIKRRSRRWSFEECAQEARKYKTKIDFMRGSSAYSAAHKKGWMSQICTHMQRQGNLTRRAVYEIIFPKIKAVYVGLSFNPQRRLSHHKESHPVLSKLLNEEDWVFDVSSEFYPAQEAAKIEAEKVSKYKEVGDWLVLNKAKAGSLGSCITKLDFETCVQEARKYKTRKCLLEHNPAIAVTIRKRGWENECFSHMERIVQIPWTIERIKEEALRYKSRKEIRHTNPGLYQAVYKFGLKEELFGKMERVKEGFVKWSKARCLETAKAYRLKSKWIADHGGAYAAAKNNGWLDECCRHMDRVQRQPYTQDEILEVAKKYNIIADFRKADNKVYQAAQARGLLNIATAHMKNGVGGPQVKWTLETCKESALKFTNRKKWAKSVSGAYNKALQNGWLEICCGHMAKPHRGKTKTKSV